MIRKLLAKFDFIDNVEFKTNYFKQQVNTFIVNN